MKAMVLKKKKKKKKKSSIQYLPLYCFKVCGVCIAYRVEFDHWDELKASRPS